MRVHVFDWPHRGSTAREFPRDAHQNDLLFFRVSVFFPFIQTIRGVLKNFNFLTFSMKSPAPEHGQHSSSNGRTLFSSVAILRGFMARGRLDRDGPDINEFTPSPTIPCSSHLFRKSGSLDGPVPDLEREGRRSLTRKRQLRTHHLIILSARD